MPTTRFEVLALLAFLGAMAGCDEDPVVMYGDLHVTYRVGSGSQTCEEAGIAFVSIDVLQDEVTSVAEETISCDPDSQSFIFDDIVAGSYTVRVEGLNDESDLVYQGESNGTVDVVADQTNGPVDVVLDQLRPSVQLWVGFADVGGCERFEIVDVAVKLYENGASVVFDEVYPCADRIEEALLIEDLSETSTYDLRVRGTNDMGEHTYEYDQDGIDVSPGPPTEVSAELTSCDGVCSAP